MNENQTREQEAATEQPASSPEQIGQFYDENADAFQRVYGDVIQAFRTVNFADLLEYEARSMELQDDMWLLDAGCGVCGPALHFASTRRVRIDGITASMVQRNIAEQKIQAAGLADRVTVRHGDYHRLREYFSPASYDVVYFLESFGHSHDKGLAIVAAWEMLKPGGRLYIKDLFVKEAAVAAHARPIEENVRRINDTYHYQISDLYDVLQRVRKTGFILSSLKTVDIPLEQFENLTISNDFQELTGIHRIEDLKTYVFPIDFFELICIKPWYDPGVGGSRYFLQNLYALQVAGVPENEL